MASPWFRLWGDMINDPKWRTIARKSGQRIGDVIAIAIHMMTHASNAEDRGRLEGWNDEDIATALDLEAEQVEAVREAMQGRTLDGDRLTGWEKRQPKRERESDDTAADRKRQQRAREAEKGNVTPSHATSHQETPRREEIREEEIKKTPKSKAESATASRLPADWVPDESMIEFCKTERPDLHAEVVAHKFRDYWLAQPGKDGRKADWSATWRNWVRNEKVAQQARASPAYQTPQEKQKSFADRLTGNSNDQRHTIIDI